MPTTARPPIRRCPTCQQRIFWARTDLGKRMPVDADPVSDGNLFLIGAPVLPTARSVSRGGHEDGTPLYKSHFASCKQVATHRRRTRTATRNGTKPPSPADLFGGAAVASDPR